MGEPETQEAGRKAQSAIMTNSGPRQADWPCRRPARRAEGAARTQRIRRPQRTRHPERTRHPARARYPQRVLPARRSVSHLATSTTKIAPETDAA
jgi:hypothetical protein